MRKCDSDLVAVFTRKQWDELNTLINAEEIHALKLQRAHEAHEKMKETSHELHKHWTNTFMGARAKKLKDRQERMEREEAERVAVDLEWAKLQAEERLKKLCIARTAQLYKTSRVKHFHSALADGDALKERDLQMKLQKLKKDAENKKMNQEYQQMLKSIKEAEEEEKRKEAEKKRAILEIHEFQRSQILDHQRQREKQKLAEKMEGDEIKRLAEEAEKTKKELHRRQLEDQKRTHKDLLDEIEVHKKMRFVERIKDEELDERIRIYDATKRALTLLLIDKAKADADAQEKLQARARQHLEKALKEHQTNEDELTEKAVKQMDAKWRQREELKEQQRLEAMAAIEAHRLATLKAHADARANQREADKADLKRRIAMDEAAHREDAELRAKRLEEGRQLANLYKQGMIRTDDLRRKERQAEKDWFSEFSKQTDKQEEIFQEYAKRVINACDTAQIPTFAMKKAARTKMPDGFGITLVGEVGTSPADSDSKCTVLPDLPPFTENVAL
ncbi:unnamed protein product [Mesocestoides corti]|uniref:TPH domain-containing protein n=1 Tax=Mesocestoides corti TaxID=53468 RepID=A0A0R3U5V8_MESCO|nr:unnamed protein product [Mesocestoides corti]